MSTTASPPEPSPLALHTHAFISAFIAGSPPSETLSKYFTPTASIHEHGPTWARSRLPFLAKTFTGRSSSPSPSSSSSSSSNPPPPHLPHRNPSHPNTTNNETPETMDDYYTHLASTLCFKPTPTTLPPLSAFNVDKEKGVVSVVLEGGFESVRTGRGWVERFVYFCLFEEGEGEGEGEGRRIRKLDLWADPLSAWVAVGGGEGREEEMGREGGGVGVGGVVGAVGGV